MIAVIWSLIRTLGPYLLIAGVIFAVWLDGGRSVQRRWDIREAQLQAQAQQQLQDASQHNANIQQALAASARLIEDSYANNTEQISTIADHNINLLHERLQQSTTRGRGCTVPNPAGTTSASDDTAAGSDAFLAMAGAGLVAEVERADDITESLRACQAYVSAIQKQFNEVK